MTATIGGLVPVLLCERCRRGRGGECHTPGCALWMNRAPDAPVVASIPPAIEAAAERWRELLEDVLRDIGEALTSEAIVETREALADERRKQDDGTLATR